LRVERTPDKKRATGVTYVNSAGEEFFQPAGMVILSAYVLQNVRLLRQLANMHQGGLPFTHAAAGLRAP